uniref:IQ calmodulin-binding motif-containing protein 1 n=1 Tax=Biomphalaria glabrata TaxID=6526 RepID=A0A2C9KEL5_BIOGL
MTDSKLSTLSSPRAADQRIISLVKQISESKDRKVPSLLLALRPIIKEYPANTQVGIKLRQEIWQYNLLKVMILILKQDFAVIEGEWETASELATLLSHIIVGLVLDKNDKRQLETDHLPKSVESILLLARHISNILTEKSPTQRLEQSNLSVNLKQVFDALLRLCSGHINLIGEAKYVVFSRHALHTLEESTVFTLLDELIYKLTVNTDKSVAQTACRCLVKFCESSNKIVQSLGTRYIGLRPLLRRWDAKGFDRDLRHIILLLESGSVVKAKNQRQQECAKYIQAIWRGYSARKKLRRADHAFAKFQKSYRLKKAKEEQVKLQTQYQSELYHQMKMRRQQLLRTLDEKRLKALEILPASQVEKYLQKEKSVAATRIQTLWRGHRERSKLTQRQMVARQVHAAIIIQRAYRKWLEKASISDQAFPTYLKPQGLTDIRRTELTKQINEWNEQNPTKIQTQEELEAIHKRAQELLVRHYQNIRPYRKLEYQCENMMARLDTDMELIQLAPRLQDVTQKDIDMYSSRSLPVATVAKQQHNETLRRLQQPWWKVLGMEEVEVNEDENDRIKAEIFLDNLGI